MSDFTALFTDLKKQTLDITKISRKAQRKILLEHKDDPRLLNLDLIWCQGHVACCIACASGFQYGFNTGARLCPSYHGKGHTRHVPIFIDNNYHNYSHKAHLERVKWISVEEGLRPKYVTVRDIMTKEQCQEVGIAYYPLSQILDWAEEIQPYTENVILIPKYDCLDQLDEKYVMGYSVPTKYGGTPLPISAFSGKRIHLLGGSPTKQIALFSEVPGSVVSLDGNYIHNISAKGQVWMPDGNEVPISTLEVGGVNLSGENSPTNSMYIAAAISIGNLAAYYHRIDIETLEEAYESGEYFTENGR